MKKHALAIGLAGIVSAAAFGMPGEASAQSAYNYRFCAVYQDRSGATSCYFSSYAQCNATVGHQGFCRENPGYVGPAYNQAGPRDYRPRGGSRRDN